MARKTIWIPVELDQALMATARIEERSFSNTVVRYLMSDVAVPMLAQGGEHLEGPAAEILDRTPSPVAEPPARAVTVKASGKGRARSQTCAHRVPAGSYCKVCDR